MSIRMYFNALNVRSQKQGKRNENFVNTTIELLHEMEKRQPVPYLMIWKSIQKQFPLKEKTSARYKSHLLEAKKIS